MGVFYVDLEIGDPQGERYESVRAMVDSGATYSSLPVLLLNRLGVVPHDTRALLLADGSRIRRDFGRAWIRLDGRQDITSVIFSGSEAPALLGAVTLEQFGLGIDTVKSQLISVDGVT